jgi:uncharacterized membrane protein YfcA
VPILLVLLPKEDPAAVTAMSLAVVFFNAYSGTASYMRMGRVDYRLGTLFTLSSLPGAVFGVLLVHQIPRELFDPLFGVLLLIIGGFLLANPIVRRYRMSRIRPCLIVRHFGFDRQAYIAVLSSNGHRRRNHVPF